MTTSNDILRAVLTAAHAVLDHADPMELNVLKDGDGEDGDIARSLIALDSACDAAELHLAELDGEPAEEARIRELEAEGMTRSDAQAAYEAEQLRAQRASRDFRPATDTEGQDIRAALAKRNDCSPDELPGCTIGVIPSYITDGPGYAGPLYVVAWHGAPGFLSYLTRDRDGALRFGA